MAIGIASLIAGQTRDSDAALRQSLEAGQKALDQGELDGAERSFLKAAAIAPKDLRAHVNLGVVYMRQKNWKRALEELRTSEKLAPRIPGIRFNIGLAYYRQGQYREAIAPFESVVRDQADWRQARQLLGLCYLREERFADATAALEPLWAAMNGDSNYLYELALSAGKAGKRELAERALTRLLDVVKESAGLHLTIAKAYLGRGDDELAFTELERAAAMNPKLPMLHFYLGIYYKRKHELEKAKGEFLQDVAIEPDAAYGYDELGTICLGLDQNDDARRYFEQALERDSQLPASLYGLAKLDRAAKRYAEALKLLDAAAALVPSSASVHYLRGQTLLQLGREAEARSEFATVAKLKREALDVVEQQISGRSYRDPQLAGEQK